jgi:RNA polymerase sigma-70 factor, ECF subfamily
VNGAALTESALVEVCRGEAGRVTAALIRRFGDFDLAEECAQDALVAALETWPETGVPHRPAAWLLTVAFRRALNRLDRERRLRQKVAELAMEPVDDEEDDRLRLIFTCCHPALAPDTQVALTLREVCGLTTEEIARAFLTPPPTLAQRIVRAKAKIRDARIPYRVPTQTELPDRLDAVLRVVYLVFNEGYAASSGAALVRQDLS